MANRIYLMPVYDGQGFRVPKYYHLPDKINPNALLIQGEGHVYSMMLFGYNQGCITALNTAQANHDLIKAQPDVVIFPIDLDKTPIPARVNEIKNFVESVGFPANWVSTSITYRAILRRLTRFCQLSQEFRDGTTESLLSNGDTLESQVNNLSTNKRDKINSIRSRRGLPDLAGTETVREILNTLTMNYEEQADIQLGDELV